MDSIGGLERIIELPKSNFLASIFTVDIDQSQQLANMYQLEGLKYYCMGSLERGLCVENVSQILQEVENLSCVIGS